MSYGILSSLDESAIESINNNAINRNHVITDKMTSAWSNLDWLEYNTIRTLDDYLANERLLLTNVIGNNSAESQLLEHLSESLINALRQTAATGAFVYFGYEDADETLTFNGLYYRKKDPLIYAPENSDLLMLRGPVEIARKNNISVDSLWQEMFTFSPEYPNNWDTFIEPYTAASNNRSLPSSDLAYWSRAITVNPNYAMDINRCITYTRPVIYEGRVVAMIGTEIQLRYLERYLSANDFNFDQCGYMLIGYSNAQYQQNNQTIDSYMIYVSGDHIEQLTDGMTNIQFNMTKRPHIYSIGTDNTEPVQAVLQPLRLNNVNAGVSDEQWAVVAVGTDNSLFGMSRSLRIGILVSSAIALAVGTVLLWYTIRRTTTPLISIAGQIQKNAPSEHIVVKDIDTYEISLLCSTINTMKDERTNAEANLHTERERYIVALESVADTVVEYDVFEDSFMLYYFEAKNEKSELRSKVLSNFTAQITVGDFCHEDDIDRMLSFIKVETTENVEVRIKSDIFSHITTEEKDGDYYWFYIKSSHVSNSSGDVIKIIGTAREFTERKLRDFAKIESSRRESTTKLLNHNYGINLIKGAILDALKSNKTFSLSIISFNNYDKFEAHYGRIFAASILMELFIAYPATDKIIKTRLSNDEVLMLIHDASKDDVTDYTNQLLSGVSKLYTGEDTELHLSVGIGTVLSGDADNFDMLMQLAFNAARHAEKNGESRAEFYSDLPGETFDETVAGRNRPINISFEVTKGNVTNYTFELFESTADTHSAVNMLLSVLGRIYMLKQITICAYNTDFDTGRITHMWNENGIDTHSYGIEKISREDWAEFETMLDENGSLLYSGDDADNYSPAVRQLLYALPGESTGGYCCVMYENGIPFGRVLFQTSQTAKQWLYEELKELYDISKIIAVNLSNEKSISASRAKSEFLSRISHEIRTPMNAIIGMTNIAKKSLKDTLRLNDSLDKIDFSAKHLLSLINNVLEMSRIESGKMDIENNNFSLDKFIRDIDKLMRPPIEDNEVSFEIKTSVSSDIQLLGDEYRLRQVIINLLSNANKFTPKGGKILFTINQLEQTENFIELFFSVKDNGSGIAIEDQPNIFKTFEQARSSSSEQKQQGSGLGLAISASIISAMGGTILLESVPGSGSNFFFTLKFEPAHEDASDTENEDTALYHKTSFSGKIALVVDDVDINLEIAKFMLEEVGFSVELAVDGQQAVDMYLNSENGYYDIIIMDIQMPVMDGLTATRNIRKNSERQDARTIPIIAMTANALDEDLKESIESGMNGHVTKPIDIKHFYHVLHSILPD